MFLAPATARPCGRSVETDPSLSRHNPVVEGRNIALKLTGHTPRRELSSRQGQNPRVWIFERRVPLGNMCDVGNPGVWGELPAWKVIIFVHFERHNCFRFVTVQHAPFN